RSSDDVDGSGRWLIHRDALTLHQPVRAEGHAPDKAHDDEEDRHRGEEKGDDAKRERQPGELHRVGLGPRDENAEDDHARAKAAEAAVLNDLELVAQGVCQLYELRGWRSIEHEVLTEANHVAVMAISID